MRAKQVSAGVAAMIAVLVHAAPAQERSQFTCAQVRDRAGHLSAAARSALADALGLSPEERARAARCFVRRKAWRKR